MHIKAKVTHTPKSSSPEEIAEHNATHFAYRSWCSWCKECVKGRRHDVPHQRHGDRVCDVPDVSLDYCCLRDDGEAATPTGLVIRARQTIFTFANVVLATGRNQDDTVDQVVESLRRLGHKKLVLKSDEELALIALFNGVINKREEETLKEHSPKGDTCANSVAERAVQEVEGQVGVMRLALQRRQARDIPTFHPILMWLVERTGSFISRYLVGVDRTKGVPTPRWQEVSRRRL